MMMGQPHQPAWKLFPNMCVYRTHRQPRLLYWLNRTPVGHPVRAWIPRKRGSILSNVLMQWRITRATEGPWLTCHTIVRVMVVYTHTHTLTHSNGLTRVTKCHKIECDSLVWWSNVLWSLSTSRVRTLLGCAVPRSGNFFNILFVWKSCKWTKLRFSYEIQTTW